MMTAWPPNYGDPIVLRLRFVPRPRPRPVVPADLTSRPGTFHSPSTAEAIETLRRVGVLPPEPAPAPVSPEEALARLQSLLDGGAVDHAGTAREANTPSGATVQDALWRGRDASVRART